MFKPPVQISRFAHLAVRWRNAQKTKGLIAASRQKYDAAQKRGEIADHGSNRGNQFAKVTNGNVATAADLGLSHKDLVNPDAADTARQIIDAAELARTGGRAPKAPTGLAREILDAAALRDTGGHAREKPSGLAAEILAAGKKRRGLSGSK